MDEWTGFLGQWQLTPETAALALALGHYCAQLTGRQLTITSGKRSASEQAALIRAYNAGQPGIFRPATNSKHLLGKAFDAVYADGGRPDAFLGKLANALGMRWGGNFTSPDPVHFDVL